MSVVVSSLYNLRRKRENVLLSLKVVATNSMLTGVPSSGAVKNSFDLFRLCKSLAVRQRSRSGQEEVAQVKWLRWYSSDVTAPAGETVFDGN